MNVTPVCLGAMFLSVSVAAQTPVAPSAPVIDAMRHPPPPVFVPTPSSSSSVIAVRGVAIVMMLGTETLWRGTLKVGGGMPARFSLSEPVGSAAACDASLGYSARPGRQIELSLSATQSPRAGVTYNLNARYSRPPVDESCGGTRAVSLDQRFAWDGNETLRFEGDGGLRISIGKP